MALEDAEVEYDFLAKAVMLCVDGLKEEEVRSLLAIDMRSTARRPLLLARVRDQVLTSLSAKTLQELSEPEGKESFREEIRERVTELVKDGQIREVFFSEFVVR